MPVHDRPPPQKKRKVEASSKQSYKYASASEILRVFQAQSESGLIEGLTALRNQLTVKANEPPVQVNDERLLLAKSWLEDDPGAQNLFSAWEGANSRQTSLLSAIVGVFSALLNLLSSHYPYHSYAQPILRTLLSQQWTHILNVYLAGQHTDLVLVTLKLYNTLSNFAGGRERKAVLDAFAWEMKSLPKLLHMRRKSKNAEDIDMLARPDIRTLYILLITSFIDSTTPSSVKAAFLEQHRDAFTSIFKGLWQDSYGVIRRVLEICWSGLWSDAKLKRTLKIQVFSEAPLSQLMRIYERNVPESTDPESVPADVVHHFLLALCSRPGVGLSFHDRGWYPRETEGDTNERTEDVPQKGGKIYNKILANVLKTLKVNEDPRQQELSLKILSACPELVSGYWSSSGLALEPRLSSKWLANIAFYGSVVSLPVPTSSFFLPESGSSSTSLYQPSPPPLSTIVENIIPTAHMKTHLSRGLQSSSPLVQHVSALTLAKCLLKYEQVITAFQIVERALEEDENEGLWTRRRHEVEREVRRRVPEFQVIVGFSQRHNEQGASTDPLEKPTQKEVAPNPTRTALLSESAHRLLWLYHRLLPSVVAEARFDAGKLLQAIEDMLSQDFPTNTTAGLDTLRQLHVLRLLQESEHFTWSGKSAAKHSNFYILLKAYTITPISAVRNAIVALLRHILAPGVLFQHDPDEITLWLDSLPLVRRAPGVLAPDGTSLTDEGDSVITFLDDCVQRCVKTPYKYVEELGAITTASRKLSTDGDDSVATSIGERPDAFPSPLLVTVVEQLGAKLRAKLLSTSDALALFSFVRKLLLRIVSKSVDLSLPQAFAEKLAGFVEGELFREHAVMQAAIRREIQLLTTSLKFLRNPVAAVKPPGAVGTVKDHVAQIVTQSQPDSHQARVLAAYEIIDWLRINSPTLQASDLSRLISQIKTLHQPALREFFQYLDPRSQSLWGVVDEIPELCNLTQETDFTTLFLHCTDDIVTDPNHQRVVIDNLFDHAPTVNMVMRAARLVLHRLSRSHASPTSSRDWLVLLTSMIRRARDVASINVSAVVPFCFETGTIKSLFSRPADPVVLEGLSYLLDVCSQVVGEDATELFAAYTGRWVLALRESLDNMNEEERATAFLWLKYSNAQEVLSLLSHLADRADYSSSGIVAEVLEEVLAATSCILSQDLDITTQALPLLCRLRSIVPDSRHLTPLIATGSKSALPLCHDGFLPARPFSDWNVASVVSTAAKQWSLRLRATPPLTLETVLQSDTLSDSVVDVITTMLYSQRSCRPQVADWLASPASTTCSTTHLIRIMFAFYDSLSEGISTPHEDRFQAHLPRFAKVVVEGLHPTDVCCMTVSCVVSLLSSSLANRSKMVKTLSKEVASVSPDKCSPYICSLAVNLHDKAGAEFSAFSEQALDLGLKWAVRYLADGNSSSEKSGSIFVDLISLIDGKVAVKSHLAEPVIAAFIQDRLSSKEGAVFAQLLASAAHLKPATVNRFLQTVVQHSKFYEYCAPTSSGEKSPREGIVSFLHTLFHLHPTNTCQPSHIEPLARIYAGSLNRPDILILSILRLFETTRKVPVTSLLSQWSSSVDVPSSNALEASQGLDPGRILRTCLDYPDWRQLGADGEDHNFGSSDAYDPVFVLLLFAQMLTDSVPSSALAWVQLFRTNVVSLLLRMLSAKDAQLREVAWAQTAALYRVLETEDLQEKPHVLHILNLLKDITPSAPSDEPQRLPAYTSLLLAHAFRGIFYPSNFIYPLTSRFLLQRPSLDPSDVPMLYGMLYSSSDEWKKERAWIVRFLSDGIVGNEEWRILKRRHTWDLLASLFQSEERDRTLRRGVLEVLANITCNARATASLILRHALFSWIEMQLPTMRAEEAIAWVRILENALAVVSASKIESATNGEWRAAVARCMKTILNHSACSQGVFIASVPVVLRLCLLPGEPVAHVPAILSHSLHWLEEMEKDIAIPASNSISPTIQSTSKSSGHNLQRSQSLFDTPPPPFIDAWGACIEGLWRIAMTVPDRTKEWDALSSRLLVWRSLAGARVSVVGEWTRRETIRNLVVDA